MFKKLWNHQITVGDSVIASAVSTAIGLTCTAIWYYAVMRKLEKMNESMKDANKTWDFNCEEETI